VSLCVIKKPRTLGGYSPARGLQNTNPQWVVAPVKKNYFVGKKTVLSFIMYMPFNPRGSLSGEKT